MSSKIVCCDCCGKKTSPSQSAQISSFVVCLSHLCNCWDERHNKPDVEQAGVLYRRMWDIAQRSKITVEHPETKALMFCGAFNDLMSDAFTCDESEREEIGRKLLSFFHSLLHPDLVDVPVYLPNISAGPNTQGLNVRVSFKNLEPVLVREETLEEFRALLPRDEDSSSLPKKPSSASPTVANSKPASLLSRDAQLVVHSPFDSGRAAVSISLRAGSSYADLLAELESSAELSFDRNSHDLFLLDDSGELLFNKQRFCSSLRAHDDEASCFGMHDLSDKSALQVFPKASFGGPPLLLCALAQELPYHSHLSSKIEGFGHLYQGFRVIKRDANCYYRAVMVSFFEQILSREEWHRAALVNQFIGRLQTIHHQEHLIDFLRPFTEVDRMTPPTVQDFFGSLDGVRGLDKAIVMAARELLANYILQNYNADDNGMRLEDSIVLSYDVRSLKQFCAENILPESAAANEDSLFVSMGLLFAALGCEGAIMTMGQERESMVFVHSTSSPSEVAIHLLVNRDSFDLLYPFPHVTLEDLKRNFPTSTSLRFPMTLAVASGASVAPAGIYYDPVQPTAGVAANTHTMKPTGNIPANAHTMKPTGGVAANTHTVKPTGGVPANSHTVKPTDGVAANVHTVKPTDGVAANAHTMKPTDGVSHAANAHTVKPTDGVAANVHTVKPTGGVAANAHTMKPTDGVSHAANAHTVKPAGNIPANTHTVKPTGGVAAFGGSAYESPFVRPGVSYYAAPSSVFYQGKFNEAYK